MNWFEALILGLIQGLTEFLPVSSSGHLELGKGLLGIETEDSLAFTVLVHGATVLSTIVVFRQDIWQLLKGLFRFQWNEETKYFVKIAISMIPIAIVGLFFKDSVEAVFESAAIILIVGLMLLLTAALLAFAYYKKAGDRNISFWDALIIGVAQTIAVIPGLSRSGTTIATGLILGNRRSEVARFSFLMVLIPIIGENLLSLFELGDTQVAASTTPVFVLIIGFISAFIAGHAACKWMVKLVKDGKLIYFAIYCAIIALIAISGYMLG